MTTKLLCFRFLNSGIIRHAWLFKIIFVHISQGCFGCVKLGFSQFKFLVDDTMKKKLRTLLLAFSIENNRHNVNPKHYVRKYLMAIR